MISIQPLWLSKNDTDIIYKKKYYKISKKIKKHLKIQYVKDKNYTIKCYITMNLKYKNSMLRSSDSLPVGNSSWGSLDGQTLQLHNNKHPEPRGDGAKLNSIWDVAQLWMGSMALA